ncbi:MAG: AAA family ATPase, partial [Agathobacter sp.]|nr:AAA family ATPase [Agathobacter sp.]
MAKGKTNIYFCQNCGFESTKWMGQCPGCREWNTFVEEVVDRGSSSAKVKKAMEDVKPMPLSAIASTDEERISTSMKELDRVLGGGIVKGSLILVGGDPGIGKSTLLLQVCRNLSQEKQNVLYVSGEESLQQIKLRAQRVGEFTDSLELLCETNMDII